MATKAERHRLESQRERTRARQAELATRKKTTTRTKLAGHAKPARPRQATGTELTPGYPQWAAARTVRNHLRRAPRAVYELEESSAARPSRKSSRKSGNRQKAGVQLKAKRTLRDLAPHSHHARQPRREAGRGRR